MNNWHSEIFNSDKNGFKDGLDFWITDILKYSTQSYRQHNIKHELEFRNIFYSEIFNSSNLLCNTYKLIGILHFLNASNTDRIARSVNFLNVFSFLNNNL